MSCEKCWCAVINKYEKGEAFPVFISPLEMKKMFLKRI